MTAVTYQMASCASGCAFHSTVGGNCHMCGGPLTAPQTVTREQARAMLLGGERYDAGKAAVLAWLNGSRS
jgi:uncharacterized Fe-S cluster-containing MiaB family protein